MIGTQELKAPEWNYLYAPFQLLITVLIEQCQRQPYTLEKLEELEELEAETRGMSVARYRENAEDALIKALLFLQRRPDEERQVYTVLATALSGDARLFESAVFAIKKLLDAFEGASPLIAEFLKHAFETVLQSPHIKTDVLAVRGSIGLFHDAASTFRMFPQLLKPVLEYLIWVLQGQA